MSDLRTANGERPMITGHIDGKLVFSVPLSDQNEDWIRSARKLNEPELIDAESELEVSEDVEIKHRVWSVFQLIGTEYTKLPPSKLAKVLTDYNLTIEDLEAHKEAYLDILNQ
jgi:hypothetical protein